MRRLEPYSGAIKQRFSLFKKQLESINQNEGGIAKFAEGYKTMGLQVDDKGGVTYREWAPNATAARLIGEFSKWPFPFRVSDLESWQLRHSDGWSHDANPMTKNPYGVWECYVPPKSPGVCAIPHDSMIKISMTMPSGQSIDRLPTWIQRVTQDLNISPIYDARFWNPPKEQVYKFKNGHSTNSVDGLKIYEAHGTSPVKLV